MKLILHYVKGWAGATLANQPCKAYIRMVIRFGLIPGAVDRGRCGCNQSGPTKFDPWQPRRDSDPDLSACKSERPTVRRRGSFDADCRAVAFLFRGVPQRPFLLPRPSMLGQRFEGLKLLSWSAPAL